MARILMSALRHSAFYSPYLMTIAGGYLSAEGLEPVYAPATAQDPLPEAIRAGRCHVAQSAVATSFADLERGAVVDIVHFAQINARDGFFIAARQPDPRFSWVSLVGRQVLVDHFFQPLAMLRYGLHRQGIEIAALDAIDAGEPDEMERAFRNGLGDYVHLQGPAPQQLEHDGVAAMVAAVGDAVGPVAFSSLCASREWLEGEMARAFVRAYRQARHHTLQAPADEVAGLLQDAGFFQEIDPAVLADTVGAYQRLGCWEPGLEISRESYENLLDVFLHSGAITRRHPYDSAIVPPPE
jgi:NitT/TauT family transport system substrate-binding protein